MTSKPGWKVHWSGGLKWVDARGAVNVRLPHYPACCSGERAEQLSNQIGSCTYERTEVTCARCRALMSRE